MTATTDDDDHVDDDDDDGCLQDVCREKNLISQSRIDSIAVAHQTQVLLDFLTC
jgi:hypothetical protein